MEYSRSFALVEALMLVALTAWLFYLNSSGSRRGSDGETSVREEDDQAARRESDRS